MSCETQKPDPGNLARSLNRISIGWNHIIALLSYTSFWWMLQNKVVEATFDQSKHASTPPPTSERSETKDDDNSAKHFDDDSDDDYENDHEDDFGDEFDKNHAARYIISWLKRCTRVTQALNLVKKESFQSLLSRSSFKICLLDNPKREISAYPLDSLAGNILQTRQFAKSRISRLYLDRAAFLRLLTSKISETQFSTSSSLVPVHCETKLAFSTIDSNSIGVSKRCCFCCNIVLRELDFHEPSAHNKIYPWIPPLGLEESIKRTVVSKLRVTLLDYLYKSCSTTPESSSGSEVEYSIDQDENDIVLDDGSKDIYRQMNANRQ